jgi:hypothetical protein
MVLFVCLIGSTPKIYQLKQIGGLTPHQTFRAFTIHESESHLHHASNLNLNLMLLESGI